MRDFACIIAQVHMLDLQVWNYHDILSYTKAKYAAACEGTKLSEHHHVLLNRVDILHSSKIENLI